jgi:hypothetical protein
MSLGKSSQIIPTSRRPRARLVFEPRDLWLGVYWDWAEGLMDHPRVLVTYIGLIPMLPLRIEWGPAQ